MTLFIVLAAILVVITLFMLIRPLLSGGASSDIDRQAANIAIHEEKVAALEQAHADGALDDEAFEVGRLELERQLLTVAETEAPVETVPKAKSAGFGKTAVGLILVLPLAVGLMYQRLGTPNAITATAGGQTQAAGGPHHGNMPAGNVDAPSMDDVLQTLRTRLESEPDNLKGWLMLGRSYLSIERFADARDTFAQAYQHFPKTPEVLTGYAQSIAQASGGELNAQSIELLDQALELDAEYSQALWLRGLAAEQQGDSKATLSYWDRLLPLVSGEEKLMLTQFMNDARQSLGLEPLSAPASTTTVVTTAPQAPPGAATSPSITLRVSLDESLRAGLEASTTVFIYARAASGPPMPLAVVRKTVADLPLEVTLDDSMAMTPTMKLSSFDQVVVGARISRTGNAMPQAGDLQGQSNAIASSTTEPVAITIDQKI